jgi:hypothetical protein
VSQPTCEFCGKPGSMDMTVQPTAFYRQGRCGQGAMTATWVAAEYSPTLDAVCCPRCFKRRFYRREVAA